jgi:hypothetical protein
MKTVRVFLPYGAHLRFDGVEAVKAPTPDYVAFTYNVKNAKGEATDNFGHAVFCVKTIAGYSVEEAE